MNSPIEKIEVEYILKANGFSASDLKQSDVGFRNNVWIGKDAVLKAFSTDNRTGQALETWFYKTAHPHFAPQLYAAGNNWILLERIHGTGLYRAWRDMDDDMRRNIVHQIGNIVCAINDIPLDGTASFLPYPENYQAMLQSDIHRLAELLLKKDAVNPAVCHAALEYADKHIGVFKDTECSLVYYDLHFDNLLLTENGRLVLLDYEMMDVAPRDLVLDVWQRMLIHPFTYANEEDHPLDASEGLFSSSYMDAGSCPITVLPSGCQNACQAVWNPI